MLQVGNGSSSPALHACGRQTAAPFEPKLCELALLANKPLKGAAFKDLADCIPGYQETAGQVAKSHHRK